MNFRLPPPSLEHMALAKIAITVWGHDDILTQIGNLPLAEAVVHFLPPQLRYEPRGDERRGIEGRVKQRILQLPLSRSILQELVGFIKPIGKEIFTWMDYHSSMFAASPVKDFWEKMVWTPYGMINQKQSAKRVVTDESFYIISRYRMACTYCLEDDIPALWSQIPEDVRYMVCDEKNFDVPDRLVVHWTLTMKGKVDKLNRLIQSVWYYRTAPIEFGFEHALSVNNKSAVEYFLCKLSVKERAELAQRSIASLKSDLIDSFEFHKPYDADILYFLLLQLSEEKRLDMLQKCAYVIINCFLDYPWQSFIMEIANFSWEFLSETECDSILRRIADKVRYGHVEYVYRQLYVEFWNKSPDAYKNSVITRGSGYILLSKLLCYREKESVTRILKDSTMEELVKSIFPLYWTGAYFIFCDLTLVEFYFQVCLFSEDMVTKFKELVIEHAKRSFSSCLKDQSTLCTALKYVDACYKNVEKQRNMQE